MLIMRILKLFPVLLLIQLIHACGKSSQDGAPTFEAPTITTSEYRGVFIAAMNVDPSFKSTSLFYYDFKKGQISEIVNDEVGTGRLFQTDHKTLFFNIGGEKNYFQMLSVSESSDTQLSSPYAITNLPDNSPLAVVAALSNDTEYLISSPDEHSLATLSLRSDEVTELNTTNTSIGDSIVVDFYSTDENIYALVAGVNKHFTPTTRQQIIKLSGDFTIQDTNVKTSALDGYALTATYPSKFVEINDKIYTIGFCLEELINCQSSIERFDPEVGSTQVIKSLDHQDFDLISTVFGIGTDNTVAAHIYDKQANSYKLAEFNWELESLEDIYTFADESLFGSTYDLSNQTYFIGNRAGLRGQIVIKSSDREQIIEMDAVPTHFALVR